MAYAELCAKVVHAFNHDLRTPLTTLLCHTELLLEAEDMPERAQRSLAAMRRAGQTLKERLADLVLAVDEHAEDPGSRVTVHLESLLRGVVGDVASSSPGSVFRVTTIGTEGLVAVVNAALLRRGVVELLRNGMAHAPRGSTVWVSSRVEAGEICIEVRDEGPGLAEPERPGAGSPAGDDPSRLRGGGLAIAGSVAAAHDGRLVLTNHPHGGFSATIHLDLLSVWGT